ncbi:alpha/beta fold hydrolase [Paracraurococcus ruber]|uniref:Alpha/beta hydrolase n=1 Tax=Paracraurococcus ruber TaxID=77675 RepID=A0ABS1D7N2_9PROT|nr:alpha/beta hydrolase [Paracraurococcus ruber]MBK1662345.1 alpha/beta hydrolase [Paracraurococcus ruber]TDG12241.1 alpha/beta hydrolase [Paracraurococcus ruber]
MSPIRTARTPVLDIAWQAHGPEDGRSDGPPVVLLHGFPYSPRGYDAVVPLLVAAGRRVIVPWLRGYGPTRFLRGDTPRSGQQAALGQDLRDLLDALAIPRAVLAGYDWGGRAACIVAALWPERCAGLVTCTGYNIQDIAAAVHPAAPEQEHRHWYQYYFHTERGRAGLAANRAGIARLLWRLWSPDWAFDDATFAASAADFDNPDFVEVVIQSYRHRFGYAAGDPALEAVEAALARQPRIRVPAIAPHGETDGVGPVGGSAGHARFFTGAYERRVIPKVGHNPPQEAPAAFARCILDLPAG